MGIGFIIPGSGPGKGPIIPAALHGYGRTDATHRYVASRIAGTAGTIGTSWEDEIGTADALNLQSSLVLDTASGIGPFVRAPQGNANGFLQLDGTVSDIRTVVLVYGSPLAATSSAELFKSEDSRFAIARAGNSTVQVSSAPRSAGNSGYVLAPNSAGASGWHFVAGTLDGSSAATATFDAASATYNPGTGGFTGTMIFGGQSGTTDRALAEILFFSKALTATELAAVRTALKAKYQLS